MAAAGLKTTAKNLFCPGRTLQPGRLLTISNFPAGTLILVITLCRLWFFGRILHAPSLTDSFALAINVLDGGMDVVVIHHASHLRSVVGDVPVPGRDVLRVAVAVLQER